MARVLVAEDDAAVRDFVVRSLGLAGHRVEAVADGAAALDRLHAAGIEIDLLLADIRMPVMDGIALALRMARDRPALPILLMTGFADQRQQAAGLESLIRGVLAKPFSLDELNAAVTAALRPAETGG
jgi:CheY-like chemotaxis protein